MFCIFIFIVAGTEDYRTMGVGEMSLRVSMGDGEFSSWFSKVRGGKLKKLVDGNGKATIVEGDEDKADAIEERIELMLLFWLDESGQLYDHSELSFL